MTAPSISNVHSVRASPHRARSSPRCSTRRAVASYATFTTAPSGGNGGADPHGHGLVGIADPVNALGGVLTIHSPATGGTLVSARLPLPAHAARQAVADRDHSSSSPAHACELLMVKAASASLA